MGNGRRWIPCRARIYSAPQGSSYSSICISTKLSRPLPMKSSHTVWRASDLEIGKAMDTLQDAHIFRSSGFELLEHLHFDKVEPPTADEVVAHSLARVRSCARRHFAANVVDLGAAGNKPAVVSRRER